MPFEDVAAKYCEDPFLKDRKGDLGFLKVDDIKPESLKKLIISLKKGQVSDIQHINDYYGIFKVTDVREPMLEPFDADSVKKEALKYLSKKALEDIRARLYRKWDVRFIDPAFKPDLVH